MPTTLLMTGFWLRASGFRLGVPGAPLVLDRLEQVVDVVALEDAVAQRAQHLPALGSVERLLAGAVPLRRELHELTFVLVTLLLNRRGGAIEARAPIVRRSAAVAPFAHLVELLVQREHFLEQRRRHVLRSGRLAAVGRRENAFELEQVDDSRDRVLQRAVRIVQIRGALEAGTPLAGCRVVEVVRVELPAERAKTLLEERRIELQLPRHAHEGEVVAVPSNRQNLGALRAEVHIHRSAAATVAADLQAR